MKKLSKFVAIAAAMVMLMAMSTSAFAAENDSMGDPVVPPSEDQYDDPYGIDGQEVTVNGVDGVLYQSEIKAPSKELVKNALKQAGFDADKIPADKIKVLCSLDIDWFYETGVLDEDGDMIWDYGTDKAITFKMNVPGVKAGETVYVLHMMHNGLWEARAYTVGADGKITVTLQGLSPVYVVQLLQEISRTNADNAGKVSPKTGF